MIDVYLFKMFYLLKSDTPFYVKYLTAALNKLRCKLYSLKNKLHFYSFILSLLLNSI